MIQDEKGGNPAPTVDNNWKITGVNLDSPLKEVVFDKVRIGELMIPTSEDGRTLNVKLLNVYELIDEGMLKVSIYTVEPGDNLWAIAKKYGMTWKELKAFNYLENTRMVRLEQEIVLLML